MWSSILPTGTVSAEQLGQRTFPEESVASGVEREGERERAMMREIERLRRERERLESEVERLEGHVGSLRRELRARRESERKTIERYEYLVGELERAAANPPADSNPAAARADERADAGLFDRVRRLLVGR